MAIEEITIKVAKTSIKMNVDGTKLELYRLAEQRLNSSIRRFEQLDSSELGADAPLALAAFEAVVKSITLTQHSQVESEEMTRLAALEQKIATHLNSLE